MWILRYCLLISIIFAAQCYNAIEEPSDEELTEKTFGEAIKESNYFVFFYVPWCGFCKGFKPIWEDFVKERSAIKNPQFKLAKVNCEEQSEVCFDQAVTGYPTLKLYKGDPENGIKFKGTRDIPTLKNFVKEHLGESMENEEKRTVNIDVIELSDDNFMSHISKGKHFIKFYAPWCSHCQNLAPTWQDLSLKLQGNVDVKIAKIDCTQNRPTCQNYDVKAYPSLLWFDGGKKIDKYSGKRDISDLMDYVAKMSKTTAENVEKDDHADIPTSAVVQLNTENFQEGVKKNVAFVKFFAPWCGHCKKLNPVWEELATKMRGNKKIKIAKVDCTANENKQLCQEQQVEGYPTLYIYKEGVKKAEYNGARHINDLQEFVLKYEDHDEL